MASPGGRWLLAWAGAYGVTHHLGLLPDGLGAAGGGTRWADWLDLLGPYLVIGTALAALAAVGTDRRGWVAAVLGGVLYAQGHGIHLAANSIANARGDQSPAHLWDEVVGHLLWYGGFAVLVVVLARAFAGAGLSVGWWSGAVAVLTGGTWATNALGADGLAPVGFAVALALSAYGWWLRSSGAGRLLILAFLPSAVGIAAALLAG
jgi:hypothetical protein